jgi:hypothetical protein
MNLFYFLLSFALFLQLNFYFQDAEIELKQYQNYQEDFVIKYRNVEQIKGENFSCLVCVGLSELSVA